MENFFVEYAIHAPISAGVDALRAQIVDIVTRLSAEYLWNCEPFQLQDTHTTADDGISTIRGKAVIGECIDDELFILYLLFSISARLPAVLVQVQDADGEVLLIEAALHLPRWTNSRSVSLENRCFIHGGKVHLISPELSQRTPTIREAVALLEVGKTVAGSAIQAAISSRIPKFPEALSDVVYYCSCIVPRDVARMLMENPQLVSCAVHQFSTRDSLNLRSLRKPELRFSPDTSVLAVVKMTRTMYGQLACQKFAPPAAFLSIEPLHSILTRPNQYSQQYKFADIGMKLTCGFEMLYNSSMLLNVGLAPPFQKEFPRGKFSDIVDFKLERSLSDYPNDQFDQVQLSRNERFFSEFKVDDDSWMTITSDDLDRLLAERSGLSDIRTADNPSTLKEMTADIDAFLHKKTDYQGAGVHDDSDGSLTASESESDGDYVEDEEVVKLMGEMDRELFGKDAASSSQGGDDDKEQVDWNTIRNFLDSFQGQAGDSGPVQTILNSLGIRIPQDYHDEDEDCD